MLTAAGLVPFTTIDYPGHLAAVIFIQGCPLQCPFCHNYALQKEGTPTNITWSEIDDFLMQRQKRLDGIVLSGGEPLKHKEINELIKRIKSLNYQVAIHTSGVYPAHLKENLPWIDWVGLDIKAPWAKYDKLTGRTGMDKPVLESLRLLLNQSIKFECRTTCDPRYLSVDDIRQIGHDLSDFGVKRYVLQQYRTFDGDIDPPQDSEIQSFFRDTALLNELKELFPDFGVRTS
ncbi:MAG: anaerobic ribonucleoside-triphosphate reductase activating protein [Alphaproteobacteria bacterium]|nr:anaerobic ribonucleoside-triphosphate reductase activating protein [Alphaproteobacteria bacterium]